MLCVPSSSHPIRWGCSYVRLTEGTLRLREVKCLAWETQYPCPLGRTPEPWRLVSTGCARPWLDLTPTHLVQPPLGHSPPGNALCSPASSCLLPACPSDFSQAKCIPQSLIKSSLDRLLGALGPVLFPHDMSQRRFISYATFSFTAAGTRPLRLVAVMSPMPAAASGTPRMEEGLLT